MSSKTAATVAGRRRPARKVLVALHFQNTPKTAAIKLAQRVSALPGTTVTSVEHSGVAHKLGPGGIPWSNIFISVTPYAIGAGLYVTKKFTDLLFELARNWLRRRNTREARRAYILGPNGKVVRCFQINGDEMEDVTERTAGSRVKVPFEESKKK